MRFQENKGASASVYTLLSLCGVYRLPSHIGRLTSAGGGMYVSSGASKSSSGYSRSSCGLWGGLCVLLHVLCCANQVRRPGTGCTRHVDS